MAKRNKTFSVASLFAGAGGMDFGFERAGFKTIWANDIDKDSCRTHQTWSDAKVIAGDIAKIDLKDVPSVDIILGGFPCQGFSLAGPRKIDDARNSLYRHFVRLVKEKQPLAFVAENVKGILTLGDGEIIKAIKKDFSQKGYNVRYQLLNAADHGVPQDRWRVILVGIRKDLPYLFEFPEKLEDRQTLRDALKGFRRPKKSDVVLESYSPRYLSRNRKRDWDDVSFTIPAMAKQVPLHPSSPDMEKIHQDLWRFTDPKKTRRLSWQEAAAIQTFPPDFPFFGNLVSRYRQIGNAVPVLLAEQIAVNLHRALSRIS